MRTKVYDEKSGNPTLDNRARAANKKLTRVAREALRVKGTGNRKRKKYVLRIERANYARLVARVAEGITEEERAS